MILQSSVGGSIDGCSNLRVELLPLLSALVLMLIFYSMLCVRRRLLIIDDRRFRMSRAGLYKFVIVTRDRRKSFKLHGAFGPFVWICGLVCIGLAAYFEYLEGFGGYGVLVRVRMVWVAVTRRLQFMIAHVSMGLRRS